MSYSRPPLTNDNVTDSIRETVAYCLSRLNGGVNRLVEYTVYQLMRRSFTYLATPNANAGIPYATLAVRLRHLYFASCADYPASWLNVGRDSYILLKLASCSARLYHTRLEDVVHMGAVAEFANEELFRCYSKMILRKTDVDDATAVYRAWGISIKVLIEIYNDEASNAAKRESVADYRFLGKPDEGMQKLLMEQLKKDPNWY